MKNLNKFNVGLFYNDLDKSEIWIILKLNNWRFIDAGYVYIQV